MISFVVALQIVFDVNIIRFGTIFHYSSITINAHQRCRMHCISNMPELFLILLEQ